MKDGGRTLRLLLVENDQADVFLIKGILRETGIDLKVTVAGDGLTAMDILDRANGDKGINVDLAILDIELPDVSGFEVLSYMKSMHRMRQIPVVVMTSSHDTNDRTKAIAAGAENCFIKPSTNSQFKTIVEWMRAEMKRLQ